MNLPEETRLFKSALDESHPIRCMVGLEGPCDGEARKGHFLQHSLIKKIADERDYVMQFYYSDMARFLGGESPKLPSKIRARSSSRYPFSCDDHEDMFQEMENPKPDWKRPRHLALLAYRTTLADLYIKQWMAATLEEVSRKTRSIEFRNYCQFQVEKIRNRLSFSNPLRRAMISALTTDDHSGVDHRLVHINREPTVAATGVLAHPLEGTAFFDVSSPSITPVRSSPIALTVLPDDGRQTLVISYTTNAALDVYDMMETLEYGNGSLATSRLSKKT